MTAHADVTTPARIFNVPPGSPFLDAVATAILNGQLPNPGGAKPSAIDLSRYTLLLPTRRATRAVQDAFLRASGGAAMLLPRIRPIGDGQEELSLLTGSAGLMSLGIDQSGLPPAISEVERRLALTQLVLKWSEVMQRSASSNDADLAPVTTAAARTPAQAAKLAAELARLVDLVETEGASLDTLANLVPDNFAEHWGQTLDFLKIITQYWPAYMAERGVLSAVDRRNRLILAEAERMVAVPPTAPVIVAGVTGSIPATAKLMQAVANLEHGAIVLPALDMSADAVSWSITTEKHPEHPQFGLAKLLATLGITRESVRELPGMHDSRPATARRQLISEAMRPAETTAHWHEYAKSADTESLTQSLAGLSLIEAPNAEDEAEIVTLILREAIEKPGIRAALISPDRLLARRVGVKLNALGISVDDSAGRPFAKTVPGAFLDLIVEVIAQDFAPAPLVALLKHPLTRLGHKVVDVRRASRALELAAFRTAYLGRGVDGVEAALERASREVQSSERRGRAVSRLRDIDWQNARTLVHDLRAAFQPMTTLARATTTLATAATAHLKIAETLARLPEPDAPNPLVEGEAGAAATNLFQGLLDANVPALVIALRDYPDLYRSLVANENVLTRSPVHPRIAIWGPMEARLQQPDIVILASLNEGTWPESTDPGPWLNRPMRADIGLPAPEEAIGRSAHDFVSALGAERVYLTRAAKIDGVPTVPSRWLMRLTALLGGIGLSAALKPEQPWLAWARARDHIVVHNPVKAPEPRPPLAMRPRRLSVTAIETWLANPYAIYAQYILGLEALDPLGKEPDAALKGAIIHAALGRFAIAHPTELPADIASALMLHAHAVLSEYTGHPRVAAFWLPRFQRFATWFAEQEPELRLHNERVVAETTGAHIITGPAGPFTLRARADRIDIKPQGLVITDYKTGQPPRTERVISGTSPQLPLEAVIALAGGFANIPNTQIASLAYIRVTGGEPPGEARTLSIPDVAEVAAKARRGLEQLIADYDDPATPYRAVRRAAFDNNYRFDDYAHLARVAEWTAETDGEESP